MEKVKAIFVSHEHTDHITGIPVLSEKYRLPVYITAGTLSQGRIPVSEQLIHSFTANIPVTIGNLSVTAFPKLHDAADPHSFTIAAGGIVVGVFTDIGFCCENVITRFKECHAVFLEANYDETLLMNGTYPVYLKKRISGGKGHLSNEQALQLFMQYRPSFMSHLILSHLSKNNNSPELVQELFDPHAGNTLITVASRYQETPVFTIGPGQSPYKKNLVTVITSSQLSLF
jgi:phosphoribosyl 1,2-cyclic phosphodiesterase